MFGDKDKKKINIGDILCCLVYFFLYLVVIGILGIRFIFGDFDLLSIPVIVFNGLTSGIGVKVILQYTFVFVVLPLILSVVSVFLFKKYKKDVKREMPLWMMSVYLILLFMLGFYVCKDMLDREIKFHLACIGIVVYLFVLGRDFRIGNMLFLAGLSFISVYYWLDWNENFETLDINYEDYFIEPNSDLKIQNKRNVIVIFAESFENKFSQIELNGKEFKINDNKAVKFSNFLEGRKQATTVDALDAALSGVYSDGKKYEEYFLSRQAISGIKEKNEEQNLIKLKEIGIANVLKYNGYKNLFIKAASIDFMQTDDLLTKEGFLREDIYDIKSFPWWDEFIKQKEKGWWGPSDKDVIKKFKELILEVNGKQPFFAVMFTVDFHANLSNFMDNPFFDTDEEIIASTINNFNEFIEWFEKQDFYENTSLVILADHKKMGNKIKNPKEKLYNAFFNVPKELEEGLNLDRTFNQVDIAPTLLELAGVKLKERQYGVGVSLFSNKKTLVER